MEVAKVHRHPAIMAAAILSFLFSLGWPLGLISGISYMIRYRELQVRNLPGAGQIRSLSGPFEALGIDAVIILANILLVVSVVFWWGFSLPFPTIISLLQAGLLASGWKTLT